jgi:aldose sugar dehydrogenase
MVSDAGGDHDPLEVVDGRCEGGVARTITECVVKRSMQILLIGALFIGTAGAALAQREFTYRTVATDLVIPWEIEFGPDGTLWTSERIGIMSRIDPENGTKKVILDRRDIVYTEQETGMLGFTWHPDFPDSPYVYVAYVGGKKSKFWRVVERYTYTNDTLHSPVELFKLDPAETYHQGCRLDVGPDRKLWVTMGDSPGVDSAAADSTLIGKILRMNLDGSVPDDNPIPGLLLYSKGHRNVQGFTRLPNGNIWTSEHGNVTEDEVNLLQPNGNYGWPIVQGMCDDEEFERPYCDSAGVIEPKWSSGNESTVAPCGMQYYNHDRYPVLKNSLLMTTLKNGTLFQFTLNDDGTDIVAVREHLQRSMGRMRDVAISPDGRIFLCTSNREPNTYNPFPLVDDDRIVELLPVEDSASAIYSGPDTVFTRARPGDEYYFPVVVTNTGTASYKINHVWDIEGDADIHNAQWRVPVVVAPGYSYGLDCLFQPKSEGTFTRRIRIVSDEIELQDVILLGSTTVGLLKPSADTLTDGCTLGEESEIIVPFVNVGTDTITVTGAELGGYNADLFEIVTAETGVIEPDDVINVRLKFVATKPGAHLCEVKILSTSYRPASCVVICKSVTSVQETSAPYQFSIKPNPSVDAVSFVMPQDLVGGEVFVYDVMGALVWSTKVTSEHVIQWNGQRFDGTSVPAGSYVVSVRGTRGTATMMMQRTGR